MQLSPDSGVANGSLQHELPLKSDANGTHSLSVDDYETVQAISAVATLRIAARVMARSGATQLVVGTRTARTMWPASSRCRTC